MYLIFDICIYLLIIDICVFCIIYFGVTISTVIISSSFFCFTPLCFGSNIFFFLFFFDCFCRYLHSLVMPSKQLGHIKTRGVDVLVFSYFFIC